MEIRNKNKGTTLSGGATAARSFSSRLLGLMFSRPRDLVLVSPQEDIPSSSIHMMFMRFPIDVVWADSGLKVTDVQRKVMPFNPFKPGTWGIYKPTKPSKYVIELGSGKADGTDAGDVIEFIPNI